MTEQINTVNVYDEARKALAEIAAIEGVTEGNWHTASKHPRHICNKIGFKVAKCLEVTKGLPGLTIERQEAKANAQHIAACDPATMQAIAALVSAQDARIDRKDAQIAALCEALIGMQWAYSIAGDNQIEAESKHEIDMTKIAEQAIANTTEAAKAYEARIRADERERCAAVLRLPVNEKGIEHHIGQQPFIDRINQGENPQSVLWGYSMSCWNAIRAMGGKADE